METISVNTVEFDAKTYIVEPFYRDDNLGLWNYPEPPPQEPDHDDTIMGGVNIRQTEDLQDTHHRNRNPENLEQANQTARMRPVAEDTGVPLSKQPEWDYISGRELADWTTIYEFECRKAPPQ